MMFFEEGNDFLALWECFFQLFYSLCKEKDCKVFI